MPRQRQAIHFSQGAEWKILISPYIGTMPFSGDAPCAVEQGMSIGLPATIPLSNAMRANVGAAARPSQSAARRDVVSPP